MLYIGWNQFYNLKKPALLLVSLIFATCCIAQDTLEIKNKIADRVTEKYHVLKGNEQVKTGVYQALYKRNIPIASGKYDNGKRTGTWFFFNQKGGLMQNYNYTTGKLQYEAPEDETSAMRYLVDRQLTDTDKTTKPIKPGGRFFGYLPYLGLYKTPFETNGVITEAFVGVVELLISPLGRLAGYKVRLVSDYYQYDQTINMDVKLFKEEDRQFIPATINHDAVLSRIVIKCRLTDSGGLDFY